MVATGSRLKALIKGSLLFTLAISVLLAFQNCGDMGKANKSSQAAQLSGPGSIGDDPDNKIPSVTLVSPSSGVVGTGDITLSMSATAEDEDGQIVRVEFYVDAQLQDSDTEPTDGVFEGSVNLGPGTYNIQAVAYDDQNGQSAPNPDPPVEVVVNEPPDDPPPEEDPNPCLAENGYMPLNVGQPQNLAIHIGMSDLAPVSYQGLPRTDQTPNTVSGGTSSVNGLTRDISCNVNDDNLDVDCDDNGNIEVSNDNVECKPDGSRGDSRSVNITMQVRAEVNPDLNNGNDLCEPEITRSFNVDYTNSCYNENIKQANDPIAEGRLGTGVAVDGDFAVAAESGRNSQRGGFHVYARNGNSWSHLVTVDPNTLPAEAKASAVDILDLGGSALVVLASTSSSGTGAHGGVAVLYSINGTNATHLQTLQGGNQRDFSGQTLTGWGIDVALHGGSQDLIVGADRESRNNGGTNAGAVYIYSYLGNNSWETTGQKLGSQDPRFREGFGHSLDAAGDVLVVGAPIIGGQESSDNYGKVYVYSRSAGNYNAQTELQRSFSGPLMRFGNSVATDGNRVIIGAPMANDDRGQAYIYNLSNGGWANLHGRNRLGENLTENDFFGTDVSISGNRAVVSGGKIVFDAVSSGAVYTFKQSAGNWEMPYKVMPHESSREDDQFFGNSLGLSSDHLCVGSENKNYNNRNNAGAIYCYSLD